MKRNEILSISLIAVVFAFSFYAATSSQANTFWPPNASSVEDAKPFVLSLPLMIGVGFHEDSRLLNQSTRMEIYSFVKNSPGTHFREICDNLGLSIGVVQYHLGLLTRTGLISVCHDGRYRRHFESGRFSKTEMKTISLLRHETVRKILAFLSGGESAFHKDLALDIGISSQALTWQIGRLTRAGLVEAVKEESRVKYLLKEETAATVKRCLDLVMRR